MTPDACETHRAAAQPCASGGTLHERGTAVRVSGRTPWRAFRLDSPEGRELLGLGPDDKCADGAFLHDDEDALELVVVELKGRADLSHAVSQLLAIRRRLEGCPIRYRAAIVASESAPPGIREHKKRFLKELRVPLVFKSGVRGPIDIATLPQV